MEHSLSASPYSILRVGKDGTVIYANKSSIPLLKIWGISKGERLPSNIMVLARKAVLGKGIQDIEVKEKSYSIIFKSPGDGHVYIYGIDLASLQKDENELIKAKEHESSTRFQQPSLYAEFRDLMDLTAKTVASTVKVESCNIFKIFHSNIDVADNRPLIRNNGKDHESMVSGFHNKEIFVPEVSPQHSGSAAEDWITCNGIYTLEIGTTGKISEPDNFPGGISVFLRIQEETFMGITLQKTSLTGFTPEEVRFLRYVLSLALKVKECKDIETKLQERICFLGGLLQKGSDSAYFKDMSQTSHSYSELSTGKIMDLSKRGDAESSILELEEIIPKELRAIYKKKGKEISKKVGEPPLCIPDICMFRENEETLKMALEVQKVLWTVINNSPAVVFLWRNEDKWPADFVTENISQLGYSAEDFTSGKILYGDIIHRGDRDRVRAELEYQIKIGNETFRCEYRVYTNDGALRWVDERTFIQRDKAGKATYFQGVVIDITERKAAEEAFEKAEKLRKKEINHRIKNNLQIVSSLLDLQAEKFSDEKVIEAFKESESRILSMSLIHQELYESGKLDSLDFSSYLHKLIRDLIRSYKTENSKIRVNLDVNSVFLGADTAVSLGIIINELFTNSFKYAFPAGIDGEINISFSREDKDEKKNQKEENRDQASSDIYSSINPEPENFLNDSREYDYFTLIYEDNGRGFPENINFRNSTSLGLQLVNALVDQIEGNIELERGRGTKFTIKFKDEIQYSS
jgi:PAS domain S-box-containing protein